MPAIAKKPRLSAIKHDLGYTKINFRIFDTEELLSPGQQKANAYKQKTTVQRKEEIQAPERPPEWVMRDELRSAMMNTSEGQLPQHPSKG